MQNIVLKLIPDLNKDTLTFNTNYRLYSTKEPIIGAASISAYADDVELNGNSSQYLSKKFRYSTDRGNWSLWYNIQDSTSLTFNNDELFVEVKYEYSNPNSAPSTKLTNSIKINEVSFTVRAASTQPNPFKPNINCTEEACPSVITTGTSTFNPYATDEAVNIFKQLSFNTNLTFGHEVIYFKTEPDRESADYVFKEWTLSKTINRKCVKVLVPGNKFPDNKPTYNEFGIDFELPFEVSIDHQYFQTVFGAGLHPRKKDFLYFPLTNRMYEIQGTYLYRGLMQEPVYWKIQLVKFQPNIDMLMRAEDRLFLDNVITGVDQLFKDALADEIKDAVNPQQLKTISGKFDETRSLLNPSLKIKQLNLTYNYSPLIQYYYEGASVSGTPLVVTPVSANFTRESIKFEAVDKFTMIAYEDSVLYKNWKANKFSSYDTSIGKPIRIKGPYNSRTELGAYIKITRYTSPKFTTSSQIAFELNGDGAVPFYSQDYSVVYNELGSLTGEQANATYFCLFRITEATQSIQFIQAYNAGDSEGVILSGAITTVNATTRNLTVSLVINDTAPVDFDPIQIQFGAWYAIFVPISIQFKQAAVSIYSFTQDPVNTLNFNNVAKVGSSSKTLTSANPLNFSISDNFRITSSVADLANIRLFNTMIQEESHDFVISQLFIKDESMLRIIDNCRPRLNIPYIGTNR